jgi:hypothetical protein
MVPVARRLRAASHSVFFASARSIARHIELAGFDMVEAGLDPSLPPEHSGVIVDQYSATVIGSKVHDLLEVMATTPVDVVVREPTDFAGLIAAETLGLPHVTLGRSHFLPADIWTEVLGDTLDEVRSHVGLPGDAGLTTAFRYLYLDLVPPWFQPAESVLPPSHVSIRPAFYDGEVEPDTARRRLRSITEWLCEGPPVVYTTMGTYYNRDDRLFRAVLEALAGEEFRVLCTLGWDQDPSGIGVALAENCRIERYVPQSLILPFAQSVVCHGGYSTVMEALCSGLPVLIVPHGADHVSNANQCEDLGVGLTLLPEELEPQYLLRGVRLLRDDRGFRARARVLAARTSSLPDLDHAVLLLERLPYLVATNQDVAAYSRAVVAASDL